MVRPITLEDAKAVVEIYNYYIANSTATFEMEPIDEKEMQRRIKSISASYPYFVFEENNTILAYAYASQWKPRKAYKHTVESSVYLHPDAKGKGIGTLIYDQLIKQLSQMDIHAVIGGVSLPNDASVALHEKFGFEKIGQFKQVGYKFNQWIDVGYWELILP